MANSNQDQKNKIEAAKDAVSDIANLAEKGIGEVWKVFVRKNIMQGVSLVFVAICVLTTAVLMATGVYISPEVGFLLIIAAILVAIAINLLGNPAYYAMEDSIEVIKHITGKKNGKSN